MSTIRTFTAGAMLLFVASTARADTINFVTGSDYRQGLGLEIANSIYDTITLTPGSGVLAVGSTVSGVDVGTLAFVVGVNCTTCRLTPTFHDAVDFTVNDVTQTFDLTYTWSSVGPVDTLTFGSPGSLSFDLGDGHSMLVNFQTPGVLSGGLLGGDSTTYVERLFADFTLESGPLQTLSAAEVPEPASLSLLGLGLGGLAVSMRRRGSRPSA